MKGKILKILGVAVTLAMVLTLAASFSVPVAASPDETINKWYEFDYPAAGSAGDWFRQGTYVDGEYINGMRELTKAINGDLYVYVSLEEYVKGPSIEHHEIFKSEDGGRSWEITGYSEVDVCLISAGPPEVYSHPGRVWDMVCSSIDEDIVYATDGFYVYKTEDAGDEWDFIARDSLETLLGGGCGCCLHTCIDASDFDIPGSEEPVISSIDVTYDDDDNPFVYIGTRRHSVSLGTGCTECLDPAPAGVLGDVLYIGEAGYPANWTSLNLPCFHDGSYDAISVGCAPDWADTKETYVVVTTNDDGTDPNDDHTWVIYTKGTICGWYEFAELLWNCDEDNHFYSWAASRIGFPDDWEDVGVLFVGITDRYKFSTTPAGRGGDVYSASDGAALDLNVAGFTSGCIGEQAVNIISLDVCGDTDAAALIAGAFAETDVYYSTDGGWDWDESAKDPTGEYWTYVIWYPECADGALAATWGCESAVSIACTSDDVEDVGESWNQISLIATNIDEVRWLGFSPGYVCEDTETMYMVTFSEEDGCNDTNSVFRHDGEYWERVFLSEGTHGHDYGGYAAHSNEGWMLQVSPDFNTTNAVYIANADFDMFRTTDAGCSWDRISFPCEPFPDLCEFVVIDEETVIAGVDDGGTYEVWKTDRHGARPWKEYDLPDGSCCANDFKLIPGYEEPGTLIVGDNCCNVSISEDGGETWDLLGDFANDACEACIDVDGTDYKTWVAFDPGYATNHFIYAAAGYVIARCEVDPDADWADQEWEVLCCDPLDVVYGIAAVGDTTLYVVDDACVYYSDVIESGGVLRSVNPDTDDADDVVFERIGAGLTPCGASGTQLRRLWVTCDTSDEGCAENVLWSLERTFADVENVWVYEDTLAAQVILNMPLDEQKLTTTDTVTLSWNELCGADCYEISLWSYCAECPDEKLEIAVCGDCAMGYDCVECEDVSDGEDGCVPGVDCCTCHTDTCIVIGPGEDYYDGYWDGLEPGTEYHWQVRVCQCHPYLSKWSEERTFMTALLPVPFYDLCSPACGSQDIILTPNFAWGEVEGATGYEVQLATTETFTAGVVKGETSVNAWVAPEPLEYATTYYWRVRAENDGVFSDWTTCIFTTMSEPVAPTPPVVVEQVPPSPAPVINIPPAKMITPTWIYAVIGVGAALAIVVIVLIVRTRRPPA